jgi:hypothetical protein
VAIALAVGAKRIRRAFAEGLDKAPAAIADGLADLALEVGPSPTADAAASFILAELVRSMAITLPA